MTYKKIRLSKKTTTTAAKKSQKNDVNCNIMADERVRGGKEKWRREYATQRKYEPSACMHANHIMGFRIWFVVFLKPGKRASERDRVIYNGIVMQNVSLCVCLLQTLYANHAL